MYRDAKHAPPNDVYICFLMTIDLFHSHFPCSSPSVSRVVILTFLYMPNLRRLSILSLRRSYLILYIVQSSRWNIICNFRGYRYNLQVVPSEQNVVGMPKA